MAEGQLATRAPSIDGRMSIRSMAPSMRSVWSTVTHTNHAAPSELEIGITQALQRPISRKVPALPHVTQTRLDIEHHRPKWLREFLAEMIGVFFALWPGMATTHAMFLSHRNTVTSSLLQIGLVYGVSIPLAIVVSAPISGGHFNPAITICFCYFHRFSAKKAVYYIIAQICGAFLAAFCVHTQFKQQIRAFEIAQRGRFTDLDFYHHGVYPGGPAHLLNTYPDRVSRSIGLAFMTEAMACCFTAYLTWACLDPANPFVGGQGVPWTIGAAYAVIIWSFGSLSICMNMARDLGARLVARIYYTPEVFLLHPWGFRFTWIPMFVSLPATFLAASFYEYAMKDSLLHIGGGYAVHAEGDEGLERHLDKTGMRREEDGTIVKDELIL